MRIPKYFPLSENPDDRLCTNQNRRCQRNSAVAHNQKNQAAGVFSGGMRAVAASDPRQTGARKTVALNEARAVLLDHYRKFVPQTIMNAMDWGLRDPLFYEVQLDKSFTLLTLLNPDNGIATPIARLIDTCSDEDDQNLTIKQHLPHFTTDDFYQFSAAERTYKAQSFGFFAD